MRILVMASMAIIFLVAAAVCIGTTVLGGYMMWTAGLNPSFFGTLAIAFFGFCVFCIGLAATGVGAVVSLFSLNDMKTALDNKLGQGKR